MTTGSKRPPDAQGDGEGEEDPSSGKPPRKKTKRVGGKRKGGSRRKKGDNQDESGNKDDPRATQLTKDEERAKMNVVRAILLFLSNIACLTALYFRCS